MHMYVEKQCEQRKNPVLHVNRHVKISPMSQ